MLRSAKRMRLLHRDAETIEVVLERAADVVRVRTAGVEHEAHLASVHGVGGELLARYWVETAPPQRILRWELAGGEAAELIRSVRLPYWQLNGLSGERQLEQLGLSPRPARTP
jgi:hypothetical protein